MFRDCRCVIWNMGLKRWEVRISFVVYIWSIIFERRSTQEPLTCPLPCSLGYTCFRSRHQNRVPECIAMEVYLSLIKGSSHGHSRPGSRHTHTDGGSSNNTGQTHSHLLHHDSRLPRRETDSYTQDKSGTRQHVIVDPHYGRRFALIPSQNHNTKNLNGGVNERGSDVNISPSSQTKENFIASTNLLKHVPKADAFEIQISAPDINLRVSPSLPQGPRPVGPLTNKRNKSVQDIINELVKSTSTQNVEKFKQSKDNGDHRTPNLLPVVSEMPNIRTTRETQGNGAQLVGRTSAILRDDQGYYFMFYPGSGAERLRVKITRAGFCSRSLPSTRRRCTILCTSDSQCRNNYKCCPNGCGLICLPPNKV